ncbi:MAG: glycoside hydrolase family 127 protein [Lachnospiraceae bacterium]|nr:glycoside hydrolase family 127 protein [Lachnospiraceae bacterium]
MTKTVITDAFWCHYKELVRKEMIPYQWKVLNDAIEINIERERNDASIPNLKSHAIENFKIAAGRTKGEHYGWVFQDSDVYKWLEAVAFSLNNTWDDNLKCIADEVVDLIADAQEEDGYLSTYYTIAEPDNKFKRLRGSHELYCAGHFMEAAVAYYNATKNEKVLDTAKKLADHIDASFGPEEGKIHGVDGHEEVEIGLMKLYHLLGEERYLKLAKYFLEERGKDPDFFEKQDIEYFGKAEKGGLASCPKSYFQMHKPVLLQDTAEGHAVRLVYMCTALADIAATTKNEELSKVCKRIWRNIVDKRMYITGGIGSTVIGESFTLDYDLPNDTMYCETCASIGLIFFAKQMLRIEAKAEYANVLERALYNTALSGMALDGKHFFYVNPLEVVPKKSMIDPTKSHVKPVRPQWLGCACCPPNLARLITSVEDYIYSDTDDKVLVNLFIKSEFSKDYEDGTLNIKIDADYPKTGEVKLNITNTTGRELKVYVRKPDWAESVNTSLDGKQVSLSEEDGFMVVSVKPGKVEALIEIPMTLKRWRANPLVSENIHKVCVSRGPQVYCVEGVDNGENLHLISLPKEAPLKYRRDEKLLGGVGVIEAEALRYDDKRSDDKLYYSEDAVSAKKQTIRMIPYYAWANRGSNEMRVWLAEE